jgi:hypothetical protein
MHLTTRDKASALLPASRREGETARHLLVKATLKVEPNAATERPELTPVASEPVSADGKLAPTSWRMAFTLAAIAVYSPVILVGLLGFARDPDCGVQWWVHLPLLPGLAVWGLLVFAHDMPIANIPLSRLQGPWTSIYWNQLSRWLQTAPRWTHSFAASVFTFLLIFGIAALFRLFPQRGPARGWVFLGGFVCASVLAGLAYAMFRA